ncbi:hypothetical protein VaNZ11_006478, partial [Volvox africanus]
MLDQLRHSRALSHSLSDRDNVKTAHAIRLGLRIPILKGHHRIADMIRDTIRCNNQAFYSLLVKIVLYAVISNECYGNSFREVSWRLSGQQKDDKFRFNSRDSNKSIAAGYSLLSCFHSQHSSHPYRFEEFLSGQLTTQSMRMHRIWWSNRRAKYPLGLFTHLSLNRIHMLEAQCRSYPRGLVAAVVWVPLVMDARKLTEAWEEQQPNSPKHLSPAHLATLRTASGMLSSLFHRMELSGADGISDWDAGTNSSDITSSACTLRLMLVYEMVGDGQMAVLMPVNALRNIAMLAVDTPLAAMVDVDLSFSWSLAGHVMSNRTRVADLELRAKRDRTGWVIPAWDVDKKIKFSSQNHVADEMLAVRPESKMVLKDMWLRREEILPFASDRYVQGHNRTNFMLWFQSQAEYPIDFEEGYEPWFFSARKYLPLYDARFRGHYYDKISNVRNTVYNKILNLVVISDVWLIHRPHKVSAQNNLFSQAAATRSVSPLDQIVQVNGTSVEPRKVYLDFALALYKEVVYAMNENRYTPVVQSSVRHCRQIDVARCPKQGFRSLT